MTANSSPQQAAIQRFSEDILAHLPYFPNEDQMLLIAAFGHFCLFPQENTALVLNGYAGTGKTSLTGALVKALTLNNRKCVLLAPTGRAAKVFADYAQHPAFTIHRKIYRQRAYGDDSAFSIADNKHTNTVFIVDEASMISNSQGEGAAFGTGRLLDDLIHYVYSGAGCSLILMGDVAQLPPVGQTESPALNPEVLRSYGLRVLEFSLKEIARQAAESGILRNATLLRNSMQQQPLPVAELQLDGDEDIEAITSEFLTEQISDCYDHDGLAETIVITRSNRRAAMFNSGIRNQILYREDELVTGDMLIVGKNNYFWAEEYDGLDFIANGDVMRIVRVWGEVENRYGLRFANVTVELPDHGIELDAKIILDALFSGTPTLTREQNERLYTEVMMELEGDKRSRYRQLKRHPYFNALQVKYAYTLTCHKAQGGQWKNVFIDMGSIPEDALSTEDFYRWLYTAITRARSHVYLINCPLKTGISD